MHILHQEFIKINYKFKQNKSRWVPAFVTYVLFYKCSCFAFQRFFDLVKRSDVSAAAFSLFNKLYCGTEFRVHIVDTEMAFFHIFFSICNRDFTERFLIVLSHIETYFFYIRENDKHICINPLGQLAGSKVFFR